MKRMQLQFGGPYTLVPAEPDCVFGPEVAARDGGSPGLYLWTIPYGDGYLIHKVGETGKKLSARLNDSVRQLKKEAKIRGVRDASSFRQGRLTSSQLPSDDEHLSRLIDQFLRCFRVFLAPTDIQQDERQFIESAIIRELHKQELYKAGRFENFLYNKCPREKARRASTPFSVLIPPKPKFHGLSRTIKC
jgi:hypothetical protein